MKRHHWTETPLEGVSQCMDCGMTKVVVRDQFGSFVTDFQWWTEDGVQSKQGTVPNCPPEDAL